jgi:endo-1,4-beta-xylanase
MSVYNAGDSTSNYGNSIPPSVLAEQGWLYESYFDLFRRLRRELQSVTIWGMADDDTWLDSFPVSRTDYPLPFDHELQAKPAYWGIVDESQLPGYGLKFSATTADTGHGTRTLTITATNGDVGPSYPVVLGDIPTSGAANAVFTFTLTHCDPDTRFVLSAPWSSATYDTGTFFTILDLDGDNDHHDRK